MPTLQFKGKNVIWNHHLSVPYHTLEDDSKLSFQAEKGEGNLIIEGDNLVALKSLLPKYQNKIKCIYIDPPYNTGNEGWVYNDNVNSPMIKEWLGKEVGSDDLTRHDKWLCMMTPRLKLLRELLADDGLLLINLDDVETSSCKLLLDEIFGEGNFLAIIAWEKRFTRSNNAKLFSSIKDNVIAYRKSDATSHLRENRNEKSDSIYSNPDNDPRGVWTSVSYVNPATKKQRPNLVYKIRNPFTGKDVEHPTNAWKYEQETHQGHVAENRLYWGENGSYNYPRLKKFLSDVADGIVPVDLWRYEIAGTTDEGSKQLEELLGKDVFDNPKPTKLIKKLIQLFAVENSLCLDAFAGSGTTMHAVMDLNNEDGGDRKCILIQMAEASEKEPKKNICKDITRERVKRAIEKYGYDTGFTYQRIGMPIDAEAMLSGKLPDYKTFAKYVFWLCAGEYLANERTISEKDFLVGEFSGSYVYLIYRQNFEELTRLALNLSLAEKMIAASSGKRIVVYAPACFLDEDYLRENRIEFVGIPYNLFQKNMK